MMDKLMNVFFFIEDDELLEKYNTILHKVSTDKKTNFLKNKIKSHRDEVTDFNDKIIPKLNFNLACLAVISLHSDPKRDSNYYP